MISHIRTRAIHYSRANWTRNSPLKSHSDMRDLKVHYDNLTGENKDIAYLRETLYSHFWKLMWTYVPVIGMGAYLWLRAKKTIKTFEVRYLSELPQKEFEAEDYEFKFWEFALPVKHPIYGEVVSSENTKGKYVLMYHGSVQNPNHMAMQRFSRIKKYMMLRKALDLECIFVALDPELDPKLLLEYSQAYGDDLLPTWAGDEARLSKVKAAFLNLGCIYVFEKVSGDVIYITDPAKNPLEAISNKILYTIGKYEDIRLSKEWMDKGKDVRVGHEDELAGRKPGY